MQGSGGFEDRGGGSGGYGRSSGGGGFGGNRGGSGRYQGDQGRGGGRGGGPGAREGDWRCPIDSCGNLNFARRTECNKCGAPNPNRSADRGSGGSGYRRNVDGGYNRNDYRGGNGDYGRGPRDGSSKGRDDDYNRGGRYSGHQGGRGNYSGGGDLHRDSPARSYSSNQEKDGYGYGQQAPNFAPVPPPSVAPYPAGGVGYPAPVNPVPEAVPPHSYAGGVPNSYPGYGAPSAGGATYPAPVNTPYAGNEPPVAGYQAGYGGRQDVGLPGGGYPAPAVQIPPQVKQCDDTCGDACDNSRIYISNLPPDVTVDELQELFGGIGQVGRIKQKRGYKDQWPWNIRLYTDDSGKNKGDAVLSYEDPSAAHCAGGFYNNYDIRGYKINVAMAERSAPRAPPVYAQGGGRGGYGYGEGAVDRRNYRDGQGSGPERHSSYGNHRARPY